MGKKNKQQEINEDNVAQAGEDTSKKFMSYKQQVEKEKKEAQKGQPSRSKNQDVASDSEEEKNTDKKKGGKRNKKNKEDDEFEEQELKKNDQGEIEATFEGVGKKNTRKKKEKNQNVFNQNEQMLNAFDLSDSDEIHEKKGGKTQKNKQHQGKKNKKAKEEIEEEEEKQTQEETEIKQEEEKEEEIVEDGSYPLNVMYCGKCGLPPEYCSFGQKDIDACKEWLSQNSPALFQEVYGEEKKPVVAVQGDQIDSTQDNATTDEPPKKKKKSVKMGGKSGDEGKIIVNKLHRGGKKILSAITGFQHYTKDLKGLASKFGKKFSCGASVAQDDIYGEFISIQGDVEDRLLELLETDKDFKLLAIPEEKIEFIDQGNKKGRKK